MSRSWVRELGFLFLVSLGSVLLLQVSSAEGGAWFVLSWKALPFNLLLGALPFALLRCLYGRKKSAVLALLGATGLGALNATKLGFLHEPIGFSDVYKAYFFPYLVKFFGVREYLAVVFLLLPVAFLFRRGEAEGRGRYVAFPVLTALVVIVALAFGADLREKVFPPVLRDTDSARQYGYLLNFAFSMEVLSPRVPEGYSAFKVVEDLGPRGRSEAKSMPDRSVVVILLESFYDLERLGGLSFREDYLPFYHSLLKESQVFADLTPKTGGGTANAEYEIFTGASVHLLPGGSVPYESLIKRDLPSIVREFKDWGYRSTAFHPWSGQAWNRFAVYPKIGFDNFLSGERLPPNANDETVLNASLGLLQLNPGLKQFHFIATTDTHAPYLPKNVDRSWVADSRLDATLVAEVNAYATALNELDGRLAKFFSELRKLPNPPIVVLFGDHQPEFSGRLPGAKANSLALYRNELLVWGEGVALKDMQDRDLFCAAPLILSASPRALASSPYFRFVKDFCERRGSIWSLDFSRPYELEDWNRLRRLSYDRLLGGNFSEAKGLEAVRNR